MKSGTSLLLTDFLGEKLQRHRAEREPDDATALRLTDFRRTL